MMHELIGLSNNWGVYVLGGMCSEGKCPGGKCPGGICPWGRCSGGTCPGGFCPVTFGFPTRMQFQVEYRLNILFRRMN